MLVLSACFLLIRVFANPMNGVVTPPGSTITNTEIAEIKKELEEAIERAKAKAGTATGLAHTKSALVASVITGCMMNILLKKLHWM